MGDVGKWLERFDCLVIGPGLGRDELLMVGISDFALLLFKDFTARLM